MARTAEDKDWHLVALVGSKMAAVVSSITDSSRRNAPASSLSSAAEESFDTGLAEVSFGIGDSEWTTSLAAGCKVGVVIAEVGRSWGWELQLGKVESVEEVEVVPSAPSLSPQHSNLKRHFAV